MSNKCSCFEQLNKIRFDYLPDGSKIPRNYVYSYCLGTREQEECQCGGNKLKCDFYPEVRERAEIGD